MRVYLAGPDVFLPDPLARAARLKHICAEAGLTGVFPLDDLPEGDPASWRFLPDWRRIALRNEAHIAGCAALIANLTPFRGPSADTGTAFELGFARALGRPIFGWSTVAETFAARTRAFLGSCAVADSAGTWRDAAGMEVEAFGLSDNLMIDSAVLSSGGAIFPADTAATERWSDLAPFRRCVAACAAWRAASS